MAGLLVLLPAWSLGTKSASFPGPPLAEGEYRIKMDNISGILSIFGVAMYSSVSLLSCHKRRKLIMLLVICTAILFFLKI